MTSRIIATGIEDALGATVLVENRSGGSGSVGMTYARNSAPDGYTVCYIPVEVVMQEILGISDIVPEDFAFIGRMTEVPAALTVNSSDDRFNSVEDFINYALSIRARSPSATPHGLHLAHCRHDDRGSHRHAVQPHPLRRRCLCRDLPDGRPH